jgi:phenylalanyl-tRNA synthetase beta chain
MTAEELAERLEMTGSAVEAVQKTASAFKGVKVGLVKDVSPHPSADRLRVCTLDIGQAKDLNIVCGAPNVGKGQKVPVVTVGGTLPGGVEIKMAELRGVTSEGMIASETELGLGEDASGILVLQDDPEIGTDLNNILELDDTVIDFEITPNRPDCMSMIGMAREVAVLTGVKVRTPDVKIVEVDPRSSTKASIDIKDPDLCPRYSSRIVTGLKVDKSPLWMRIRLNKAGIRPVNNLVDITNYVLVETGQPLHAFDLKILKGNKIIVRRAGKREEIETLDGVKRALTDEMLVIADAERPVAIAGIMGGADTEISASTIECLIESAYFKPSNICRTSYALDLRSEASSRFERGIDPESTLHAAERAAQMMQDIAGGRVLRGSIDEYPKRIKPTTLSLRQERVNKILGTSIEKKDMKKYLNSIEFEVTDGPEMKVTVPTFRPDIEREIDLVEEIARIYGFERIESTLPRSGGRHGGLDQKQKAVWRLRDTLVSAGLQEVITYAFIDPADLDRLAMNDPEVIGDLLKLKNPLSAEQGILRPTLLPGLMRVLRYNASYGNANMHIFEMGRTFKGQKSKDLPEEEVRAAGLLWGPWERDHWYAKSIKADFFDAKGIIQAVMERSGIDEWRLEKQEMSWLQPGQSAVIKTEGEEVGYIGKLHPAVAARYEIEGDVFIFEISADRIVGQIPAGRNVTAPSRYPSIVEDVAVIVDDTISAEQLDVVIKSAAGHILKDAELFDEYKGSHIPAGKKSMAYHLVFQAPDRTLTDQEAIQGKMQVVEVLINKVGAEIRK